ncbi:MAG: iron chelate uptake ABC transporter family permease subunit [Deltaproteobacteria bacterium]|nr:iron chelate uptake ABC transporter family permease subunit [Deltaproteobacteria bacterium]
MSLELQIILPGFLACLLLTGFLAYLGLHVLAREVIFVDIALAQIAALGTACASFNDIEPHTVASYGVSLGFTFAGAALFALTRGLRKRVPQEAFIGIAYAVAAASAILVARFLPHGDEEIREILIGSLLTVTLGEVGVTALIFAALAVVHFVFRQKFLELSFDRARADEDGWKPMLWDLLFYATFGVVITSSVQMAGVLLVFSFLIVPAVFSALFAKNLWTRLLMAWSLGATVSALGLWGSFKLDLPTGAAVVVTFGIALVLAALVRAALSLRAKD